MSRFTKRDMRDIAIAIVIGALTAVVFVVALVAWLGP